MSVNFEEINKNIEKEGLNTEYITIMYENLTGEEMKAICKKQGAKGMYDYEIQEFRDLANKRPQLTKMFKADLTIDEFVKKKMKNHDTSLLANYPVDKKPLYPKKAKGVMTLEA